MIVTLTLGPKAKPELRFVRSGEHRYLRFIHVSGEPQYKGTYTYWNLRLIRDGIPVERPKMLSITVRETEGLGSDGHVTYIEAYEDSELGLREPTQFSFEADYEREAFEKLWNILSTPYGDLTVSVSIRAPRTDASGHEAIFEVSEGADTWPADGFYVSRT